MINYDSIGIVGGGSWGTTLAHLLGKNGHRSLLWMRDQNAYMDIKENRRNRKHTYDVLLSEKIYPTMDLEEVALRCEIIIIAIPSSNFREVTYLLGNHVKGDQILISACKGLEPETHYSMTEIIKEETCAKKIGVLSGPNLFQEILKDSPSAGVIASEYQEATKKIKDAFCSSSYKIYTSEDIVGVELGGVMKNVIAIASGIADGLGFGSNTKALVLTRGIAEMVKIGLRLGANPYTFTGLSGLGDMFVTCSSSLSRNYRVGYYLAQGQKLSQILEELKAVAEGVNTSKVLHEYCRDNSLELPIINGVYQILYENKPIQQVLAELMNRLSDLEMDNTLDSL